LLFYIVIPVQAGMTNQEKPEDHQPAIISFMTSPAPLPDPSSFPDEPTEFTLQGPVGALEAISDIAERPGARRAVAVICHPNSKDGGTMRNKVVTMLERSLRESGLDTVRFNFRSAGESAGAYDNGIGETDDLAAVVKWVRTVRPNDALWLAGFSFGSYVTLRSAVALRADALISIAPPVGRWSLETLALPTCPWLVVMGEEDEIVEPQAVFDWIDSLEQPPELIRMPETGHFFHRRLMDLRGAVKHAIQDWLPPSRD
jgi:alpha/beta superfamily hydrolase